MDWEWNRRGLGIGSLEFIPQQEIDCPDGSGGASWKSLDGGGDDGVIIFGLQKQVEESFRGKPQAGAAAERKGSLLDGAIGNAIIIKAIAGIYDDIGSELTFCNKLEVGKNRADGFVMIILPDDIDIKTKSETNQVVEHKVPCCSESESAAVAARGKRISLCTGTVSDAELFDKGCGLGHCG